jgi:hypothetical protein
MRGHFYLRKQRALNSFKYSWQQSLAILEIAIMPPRDRGSSF